jgi:SNF2 family DNA or RNA helicase
LRANKKEVGLNARHRLALTGTPVENNLGELWALYDAVAPGLLGDRKTFTKQWRTPIEKQGDTERQGRLSRRLRPFLLRRTKGDVLADLPPRTDIVEHVSLEANQRAVYEAIRLAMHTKVREAIARKGLARSRIELLEALLRLQQVCCDPRLVAGARQAGRADKVRAAGSAKLDRLMEMLPELVAEGRRVLLFSQFTSMLDLIEAAVTRAGIPDVMLTGQTRDRTSVVKRFQKSEGAARPDQRRLAGGGGVEEGAMNAGQRPVRRGDGGDQGRPLGASHARIGPAIGARMEP